MEIEQAQDIVQSLMFGRDPKDKSELPKDSVLHRAEVIRAMSIALAAMRVSANADRKARNLPPRTGEPWSEDEDRKLLSNFDAGHGLHRLAESHQRSAAGVRARLVKYGRLAA